MTIWLIYLVSLTEPRTYVATISQDSIYFYHHEYQRKKIIHKHKQRVFVFDEGYMIVTYKSVIIEFFNGEKITYKITREIHEYQKE